MDNATLTAANDDTTNATDQPKSNAPVVFSLPEQVMPNMWLTDYDSLYYNSNDEYWEPPIDRHLLANLTRRNAQHGGIVQSLSLIHI